MSVFQKKQLAKTKRICLKLKEAREAAGIDLNELSKKTKISKKHLKALEECRFDDIPFAIVYQKNFVKRYAEAVGISSKYLLSQFLTEEVKPDDKTRIVCKKIKKNRFQNLPLFFKVIASAAVIFILAAYLGIQVRSIVRPPRLAVYVPKDGFVTSDSSVIVSGKTDKEVRVFINGQEIVTNSDGRFEETLNLSPGINTLVISAKKKHGKTADLTRHVIFKEDRFIHPQ